LIREATETLYFRRSIVGRYWGEVAEAAEDKGEGRRAFYSYEDVGAIHVVVIDDEKEKGHKTGYIPMTNL
jgi:hypothetical protein